MNESYYSKVDSCILVYDITDLKTFNNCEEFNKSIKEKCKKNVKLMLLGNKSDLKKKDKSKKKKSQSLQNQMDIFFTKFHVRKILMLFLLLKS